MRSGLLRCWVLWILASPLGIAQPLSSPSPSSSTLSLGTLLLAPWRGIQLASAFLRTGHPIKYPEIYAGIFGWTAALLPYDPLIVHHSQRLATKLHLISDQDDGRQTHVLVAKRLYGITVPLHVPKGPNACLYYLGDGLTSLSIAAGLVGYSFWQSDEVAFSTAHQLLEAISLTGVFTVLGKVSTGRESPFRASVPGGMWRGYRGLDVYLKDVSKHDAFPSGHIATAMTTVRILAENYTSYRPWIYGAGYTGMGLLMWAMLNNGVHWASDYPLGLAIGYHAASTVLETYGRYHALSRPKQEAGVYERLFANTRLMLHGHHGLALQKSWDF